MKTIPLNHGHVAYIDDDDYENLIRYKWGIAKRGKLIYAQRNRKNEFGKWSPILMHIQLMKSDHKIRVDHKDGNGLNNQRSNLRPCTASQNGYNIKPKQGKPKGVSWDKRRKVFRARVMINRKDVHIGYYNDIIEAAKAYDEFVLKNCGEFAVLNFNK